MWNPGPYLVMCLIADVESGGLMYIQLDQDHHHDDDDDDADDDIDDYDDDNDDSDADDCT